jgi:hypothetical protein
MKRVAALLGFALASAALAAHGATFALNPIADAFVTTGPSGNLSGNNYGGAGSISVSAPGLPQGELQSVLRFDLSAAAASFDAVFGAGQWSVSSVTLQLTATAANNAIFNTPAAGQLAISWLQNDSWTEGTGNPGAPGASGITFASLQNTFIGGGDQGLGGFAFSGATSGASNFALGLTSGLIGDVLGGSTLSLRLLAADSTVSGVFNSRSFGTAASRPQLAITAVPEPDSWALIGLGLGSIALWRRSALSPPSAR